MIKSKYWKHFGKILSTYSYYIIISVLALIFILYQYQVYAFESLNQISSNINPYPTIIKLEEPYFNNTSYNSIKLNISVDVNKDSQFDLFLSPSAENFIGTVSLGNVSNSKRIITNQDWYSDTAYLLYIPKDSPDNIGEGVITIEYEL